MAKPKPLKPIIVKSIKVFPEVKKYLMDFKKNEEFTTESDVIAYLIRYFETHRADLTHKEHKEIFNYVKSLRDADDVIERNESAD